MADKPADNKLCKNSQERRRAMTKKQAPDLWAKLSQYKSELDSLPANDAQWVDENPKEALVIFVEGVKNRPKPDRLWLALVRVSVIPATAESFVARNYLVVGIDPKTKVNILRLGDDLCSFFLDKVESQFAGSRLRCGKLQEPATSREIIYKLGGEKKAETTLAELWSKLKKQPNGRKGDLLTDGGANLFCVPDVKGELRIVEVHWRGGWCLYAHPIQDQNRWAIGTQVFSRKYKSKAL
jgi:hypothetical protein